MNVDLKAAMIGFGHVCLWHLLYLVILAAIAIMTPSDDIALFSPGTMTALLGLLYWGLLQGVYLLPLLFRARKQGPERLTGMLAGAVPPALVSLQLFF